MISTSLPSIAPKNQLPSIAANARQTPQPAFAANRPDSFHRTEPTVRFGADAPQAIPHQGADIRVKTTRDAVVEDLLNSLKTRSRSQSRREILKRQEFLGDLQSFHTRDRRAMALAELWPERYVQNIGLIVGQARTFGTDAGRGAFEDFKIATHANTTDNRVAKQLYMLRGNSPDLPALKSKLQNFHTADPKAKAYAELHPKEYAKKIESIVHTARNHGTHAGRVAFELFRLQTYGNTLDNRVADLMYTFRGNSDAERALKNVLGRFHAEDMRASTYAELNPEDYELTMRNIVHKAQLPDGDVAGRAAFEQFLDYITPQNYDTPSRTTTSSNSLLDTAPDPGYLDRYKDPTHVQRCLSIRDQIRERASRR
jgi:hypothetical protein